MDGDAVSRGALYPASPDVEPIVRRLLGTAYGAAFRCLRGNLRALWLGAGHDPPIVAIGRPLRAGRAG